MNEIKIVPVNKDLISKIRTQISVVEKQNMLIQNKEVWNRLCASLDCIEDSMWAVQYYIESNYPNDFRGKYLFTYGLLQAVFLQQDALNHIHLSLFGEDLNYKSDYPNLYKIREIRNDVTGHPTERTKGGKNYYIYLNQGSMKKWGFEYLVCSDDTNFKYINIAEVLSSQNQSINNILQKAVTQLNKEFKEYINMHKDKKMLDIFKGLNYTREKLLVPRDVDHCLKTSFLESIKEMVEACKTELNRRYVSWEMVDSFGYIIKEIDELLDIVLNRLPLIDIPQIEKHLLQHLFCKMDKLTEYCKETDLYFENDGEEPVPEFNNESIEITFVD